MTKRESRIYYKLTTPKSTTEKQKERKKWQECHGGLCLLRQAYTRRYHWHRGFGLKLQIDVSVFGFDFDLIDALYLKRMRIHGVQCCSSKRTTYASLNPQTPPPLKIAVSAVTELLRLFSPSYPTSILLNVTEEQADESPASSMEDVLLTIQSDYANAYFVTGNFTPSIYAEDCIFEDPTISFRGSELYARNLKLLVPFFDCASITLEKIEKVVASDTNFIAATWKLRTGLKLPWRPLICIEGSTLYELDENFKIVKHIESWNVSALEAIGQIFNFNSRNSVG